MASQEDTQRSNGNFLRFLKLGGSHPSPCSLLELSGDFHSAH